MDIQTVIIVLIPSVLSSAIAITQIVLNYKKSKEPKRDEVWETATQIILSEKGGFVDGVEGFAEAYESLAWFKAHGCSLGKEYSLSAAIMKEKDKLRSEIEKDPQGTRTNSQDETQMSDD